MIVVAKVGSTSITSDSGEIDDAAIGKFCAEVVRLRLAGHRVVMVTSGAIAAGLPALGMSAVRPRDAVTRRWPRVGWSAARCCSHRSTSWSASSTCTPGRP
jgi:glutamate 5-kinase